jgi:hypothetical protein
VWILVCARMTSILNNLRLSFQRKLESSWGENGMDSRVKPENDINQIISLLTLITGNSDARYLVSLADIL